MVFSGAGPAVDHAAEEPLHTVVLPGGLMPGGEVVGAWARPAADSLRLFTRVGLPWPHFVTADVVSLEVG
jgi:hypothetical protein